MSSRPLASPAKLFARVAIALTCCLPFLVPFDAYRSIELQGMLLAVAGLFAWAAIALEPGTYLRSIPTKLRWLLAIYSGLALLSSLVSHGVARNLLGASFLELGSLGLTACLGCGIVIATLSYTDFSRFLYILLLVIGLASIPFSLVRFHSLERLPGIFFQADIMAMAMGCGLLIGLDLLRTHMYLRWWLYAGQATLLGLLILTGTRIAIASTLVLMFFYIIRQRLLFRQLPILVAGLLFAVCIALLSPSAGRLTDASFATHSVSYRLALQSAGAKASLKRPLLGYGPGQTETALNCPSLHDKALTLTCNKGFYFNSSHNIFLDRIIMIGWLGGLSYVALVVLSLRQAWGQKQFRIISYCVGLISFYYCTNVTSVTLELLFCMLLMRLASAKNFDKA